MEKITAEQIAYDTWRKLVNQNWPNIAGEIQAACESYASLQTEELRKENARLTEVEDCNKRTILNQQQTIGELRKENERLRDAVVNATQVIESLIAGKRVVNLDEALAFYKSVVKLN